MAGLVEPRSRLGPMQAHPTVHTSAAKGCILPTAATTRAPLSSPVGHPRKLAIKTVQRDYCTPRLHRGMAWHTVCPAARMSLSTFASLPADAPDTGNIEKAEPRCQLGPRPRMAQAHTQSHPRAGPTCSAYCGSPLGTIGAHHQPTKARGGGRLERGVVPQPIDSRACTK
jgi:hypothetical protein